MASFNYLLETLEYCNELSITFLLLNLIIL